MAQYQQLQQYMQRLTSTYRVSNYASLKQQQQHPTAADPLIVYSQELAFQKAQSSDSDHISLLPQQQLSSVNQSSTTTWRPSTVSPAASGQLLALYDKSELVGAVCASGFFYPHLTIMKTSQGLRRIKNRKKKKMQVDRGMHYKENQSILAFLYTSDLFTRFYPLLICLCRLKILPEYFHDELQRLVSLSYLHMGIIMFSN